MPDLSLSVVVCTHNRPDDLARCLEALLRLEDEVEVIVVDSASDVPCREPVERYGFRYVREENPGLSRARNRGIAEACGEIVAFLDDDAAPRPDWARRIAAPFAADPEIGCVGGALEAVFVGDERPRWLSDRLLQFSGITNFGPRAREARSSSEWPFGANMAFRAELVAEGFPEQLGRIGTSLLSGEESALIEALQRRGWKIWLEPRASVDHSVHPERCRSSYYWRRLWWAGVTKARSRGSGLRLLAAAPVRFGLYLLTRDRVYLYRTAETAGWLAERLRGIRPRPAFFLATGLFGLGLAVRIAQQRRGLLYPDGYQYLLMARGIAEHLRPTTVLGPGGELFVPSADAATKPLYPALVAGVHELGAGWLHAARIVTEVSSAAAVAFASVFAARLSGSRAAGAAAGVLLLASPALAYWSGFSGPDPLAQALALGAATAFAYRRPALGGALAGLAAAARPELLVIAAAAAIVATFDRRTRSAAIRGAVACALALAAILLLLRPPLGLPSLQLILLALAGLAAVVVLSALPSRFRAAAIGLAVAAGIVAAAGGLAPGIARLWHDDWTLLALAGAALPAALVDRRRRTGAVFLLGATALLAAVYWTKNPNLERYPALLLPLAAILAAVGAAALPRRGRALSLAAAAPLLAISALHVQPTGNRREDMFAAMSAQLERQLPRYQPLVSAAPDAYGFWLPERGVRTMRPGERGLILLDAAQRAYEPSLGARGHVLARLADQIGFVRPDGLRDAGPVLVVAGRVERTRPAGQVG